MARYLINDLFLLQLQLERQQQVLMTLLLILYLIYYSNKDFTYNQELKYFMV